MANALPTVRSQGHTEHTIVDEVIELKKVFPEMGARTLVPLLRQNFDIFVKELSCLQCT